MIKIVNTPSFYSSLYEVANFCAENDKFEVEIIVPDKLSLFMEKFIFEHLHISASFNIKVSTLNRFAKRKCVVDKAKQISNIGSVILINKILNEHAEEFTIFKNKLYSFSYAENIFSTIGQLKASKINFDEMKGFKSKNLQLEQKIHDLALVYEYYETEKAGLLDASDMFIMSALYVAKDVESKKIVFVGFDDFTSIEYSIIEQLALACEVVVLNYKSQGNNKFIFNSEVFDQLKDIAYKNEIGFVVENGKAQFGELKTFLHNNLFGSKDEKLLLKDYCMLFSGSGVESELEFVARDIREDILNGQHFGEFGIAIYNLEQEIDKIKQIFAKYEINYYIDSQLQLSKSIFYKFIVSILKYYLNGNEIVNLIDVINSPFFSADEVEKHKLIDRLISLNFVRLENLNLGDEFSEIKQKLLNFISLFELKPSDNAETFVNKLLQADEVLNFDEILKNLAVNCVDVTEQLLITKSKEQIFNLFSEILKFYKNANISQIFDIFVRVSNLVKFNNLPQTLDAVKIVDANNTMEIFDYLYIVNCTAENAPNLKFDCGIILDGEIEELNFKNKLAPTIAHINKLAKLRLYNLATMFENGITITSSFTQSDLIKDLCNKIVVNTAIGEQNLKPIENIAFDKYRALSKADYFEFLLKFDKENSKIYEKIHKKPQINTLNEENLKIFNNLKTISASQLENYFKCPFYYFLNNILKITPRLENKILAMDIGNIIHEILHEYYDRQKNVGDLYEFCKTQIFSYINKNERLKLNANSPTILNLIDEVMRVIAGLNLIDEHSLFVPFKFELEFKDNSLGSILLNGKVDRIDKLKIDDNNTVLRVIDYKSGAVNSSLDELYYGNKLQLFLYATAMENMFKNKVVGEFYLPLHNEYKKAETNNYQLKGYFVNDVAIVHGLDKTLQPNGKSSIVNLSLSKDGLAKRNSKKELEFCEMERLKNYAVEVSKNAVNEIKAGFIKPSPTDLTKICAYCPYAHICMHATNNINARMCKGANLESFELGGEA